MSYPWYRQGTITLTNGSAVVTGTLTGWGNPAFVREGDALYRKADGLLVLVDEIATARGNPAALNTELELRGPWAGDTLEDVEYAIMPMALIRSATAALAFDIATFTQSISVFVGGEGPPAPEYGANGWGYFDSINNKFHIKAGGEWNAGVSIVGPQGPAGPNYQATSTSSVAIDDAVGNARTWTVQAGRGYTTGQRLRATFNAANYVEGPVTSYSGTTLVIAVDRAVGSGTRAAWNINITGDIGPAMNLTVGTVTTGAPGSNAAAEITGSLPNRVLHLSLPRGNVGPPNVLEIGEVVEGSAGASITGDAPSQVLNLSIPKGAAATVEVGEVTTVEHDEAADVDDVGEPGAAVFNFKIPRGVPGAPLDPRGDYNAGTEYTLHDVVRVLGSSWVYINDTPAAGNAPPALPETANAHWELLAQAGSNGTGAVDLVNGRSGIVVLNGSDIEANVSPSNYTPAGASVADHLTAIDSQLGSVFAPGAAPGRTVASASTVDLGASSELVVTITGTTTIGSFGAVANIRRVVIFAGALTLQQNPTSLITPGMTDFQTEPGDTAEFRSDASGNWRCVDYQRATGKPINTLSANRTYYVRADGSDSNSGLANTSGGAFLTVQKAVDAAASLNLSIYNVGIQIGNGTYAEAVVLKPLVGAGECIIVGDETTPANVNVTSFGSGGGLKGSSYRLRGLKLGGPFGIDALGGNIFYRAIDFGAAATAHIRSGALAYVEADGNYSISGNAGAHVLATQGGTFFCVGRTVTLSGTPAFGTTVNLAFMSATRVSRAIVISNTFSGSATGRRYVVASNATIDTNGAGATHLPGNSAGSAAADGEYV